MLGDGGGWSWSSGCTFCVSAQDHPRDAFAFCKKPITNAVTVIINQFASFHEAHRMNPMEIHDGKLTTCPAEAVVLVVVKRFVLGWVKGTVRWGTSIVVLLVLTTPSSAF